LAYLIQETVVRAFDHGVEVMLGGDLEIVLGEGAVHGDEALTEAEDTGTRATIDS
jgi:hypothetical protein